MSVSIIPADHCVSTIISTYQNHHLWQQSNVVIAKLKHNNDNLIINLQMTSLYSRYFIWCAVSIIQSEQCIWQQQIIHWGSINWQTKNQKPPQNRQYYKPTAWPYGQGEAHIYSFDGTVGPASSSSTRSDGNFLGIMRFGSWSGSQRYLTKSVTPSDRR